MVHTRQNGFTLIEILVGLMILVIVGLVTNSVLTTTFRATRKSNILQGVKQNGDYAIAVMEVKIHQAKRIVSACDTNGTNSLTIENVDETQTTQTTFSTTVSGQLYQAVTDELGVPMNLSSGNLTADTLTVFDSTDADTLLFKCDFKPGSDTRVDIEFWLRSKSSSGVEDEANQKFSTVLFMKNY